jgi:prespore-specific regulator
MKVRQDAWSHEDDLLLAETVLRYIREGGTQLAAFEEVGDKLNRTSAACGFRWNAEVRKTYEQAVSIAKRQRKERKRALERSTNQNVQSTPLFIQHQQTETQENNTMQNEQPDIKQTFYLDDHREDMNVEEFSTELLPVTKSITLEDCISFLSSMRHEDQHVYRLKMENDKLSRENNDLVAKSKQLEKRIEKLTAQQATIQEDYQALVQIMDRARRMVMFDEQDERQTPTFRMDKNGNLEQVAK